VIVADDEQDVGPLLLSGCAEDKWRESDRSNRQEDVYSCFDALKLSCNEPQKNFNSACYTI
jgi:hypothetical protein